MTHTKIFDHALAQALRRIGGIRRKAALAAKLVPSRAVQWLAIRHEAVYVEYDSADVH